MMDMYIVLLCCIMDVYLCLGHGYVLYVLRMYIVQVYNVLYVLCTYIVCAYFVCILGSVGTGLVLFAVVH